MSARYASVAMVNKRKHAPSGIKNGRQEDRSSGGNELKAETAPSRELMGTQQRRKKYLILILEEWRGSGDIWVFVYWHCCEGGSIRYLFVDDDWRFFVRISSTAYVLGLCGAFCTQHDMSKEWASNSP